jgi:hypothetical protein
MALVVMGVFPSGEGKSESVQRNTMVLPGRNTVASKPLKEIEKPE